MGNVVSTAFPDSLDPVFARLVEENFNQAPDLVPQLFNTSLKSSRDQEKLSSISSLPDFPKFTGTLTYKSPTQGYDVTAQHIEFAMGVQIQRKLWDDDQHGKIRSIFEGFGDSAFKSRQKDAAQPFNLAFSVDPEFYTHTEGVSLCNDSHTTTVSGVSTSSGYDNLSTAAISATSLTADRYTMRLFKDFQGEPVDEVFDEVFCPAELEDEVLKIVQTRVGLDTAAGDVNVHAGRNFKVISSVRLTDANNYFVMNSKLRNQSLYWIDRIPFEKDRMDSFDQYNFKGRAYMRYSFVYLFWQWILGHSVS